MCGLVRGGTPPAVMLHLLRLGVVTAVGVAAVVVGVVVVVVVAAA